MGNILDKFSRISSSMQSHQINRQKVIILAAGEGKRLRPLTNDIPKCMVSLKGIPLIERNMENWKNAVDCDFLVVSGYKRQSLAKVDCDLVPNLEYDSSNMVWSLLMALPQIERIEQEYVFISYGDIVLSRKNIEALVESNGDINVIVDRQWEELWSLRMADYMSDVETLKVAGDLITEVGKKPSSRADVQGQYIGVLKIKRSLLIDELRLYQEWVANSLSPNDSADRKNLYMTDFIQMNINKSNEVKAVFIDGGWLEVDSVDDLVAYEGVWGSETPFADLY